MLQILCNRNLGSILKKVSIIRHQVLRSMCLVFGPSPVQAAARERYFKSWQGHVATSKTTPFECEPSSPMLGKSDKARNKGFAMGRQAPLKCCCFKKKGGGIIISSFFYLPNIMLKIENSVKFGCFQCPDVS